MSTACSVVIFGVTGDLSERKLIPAVYNLGLDKLLPDVFHLYGFARREWSQEDFRRVIENSVKNNSRRSSDDTTTLDKLVSGSDYIQGNFDTKEAYLNLKEKLEEVDNQSSKKAVRIFYLSTSPEYFHTIAQSLKEVGLLNEEDRARTRVIVEKPFGHNLPSAKELNSMLLKCMEEQQIYRIDHYLGKETVQNLLVFRFSNGIFEPIWNRKYISHVEISVCESIGVGSRAGYFDNAGILRDVVQNHAFQLMTLVAMEPPVDFTADAVRDEKVKVLRSVKRIPIDDVAYKIVRARYLSGKVGEESVVGYLGEKGVADSSETETFVAMELAVDNWRWSGVPFFIRAGKRLKKRVTEISVHFRSTPQLFFRKENIGEFETNVLTFQIQPEEGIKMRVNAKPPGQKMKVMPVNLDFTYKEAYGIETPEAYERLILDCVKGDPTLFTRNDEIEQSWDILEPIFAAWSSKGPSKPPVFGYDSGTWGPPAADQLLLKHFKTSWNN